MSEPDDPTTALTRSTRAGLTGDQDRELPTEFVGKLAPNYYCRGWNPRRLKYCGARAGRGTDHPCVGRCKHHDGGGEGRVRHGLDRRYGMLKNKRMQKLIDRYANDPDPFNVGTELVVTRALLHTWIDNAKANPGSVDLTAATRIIDTISKLVYRAEQIRQHGTISLERVRLFMLAVDRVLEINIADVELRQRIRRDISASRV